MTISIIDKQPEGFVMRPVDNPKAVYDYLQAEAKRLDCKTARRIFKYQGVALQSWSLYPRRHGKR